MQRFFADDNGINARGEARLAPEDERHARQVLRLKEGDPVILYAGGGAYRDEPIIMTARAAEEERIRQEAIRRAKYSWSK